MGLGLEGNLAVLFFCGLVGLAIGSRKGINPLGAFFGGVFLGPLCFLMIFISKAKKDCPACGEKISAKAVVCRYCNNPVQEKAA